jgi:hypothetical protein
MTNLSRARERVEAMADRLSKVGEYGIQLDCDQARPFAADLRAILSALDGLGRGDEPGGWQGIESAPRDEPAEFWLEWKDEMAAQNPPLRDCYGEMEQRFRGKFGCWSSLYKATHWRPLDDARARLELLVRGCAVEGLDHLPIISRSNAEPFAKDLRTLLAALPNPTAPSGLGGEGWRLVPVEPTAEQIKAIARAFGAETGELLAILMDVRESETLKVIVDSYHAALAASPQPPTAPSRERVGELIEAIRPFADLAKKFLDRPLPLDKRGVVLRVPLGAAQQGRTGADLDIYPDAALTIGHFRAAARALDRIEEPEGKG